MFSWAAQFEAFAMCGELGLPNLNSGNPISVSLSTEFGSLVVYKARYEQASLFSLSRLWRALLSFGILALGTMSYI